MSYHQQLFDFKSRQLAQAKHKRKILEDTLAGTSAETELLQNRLKSIQFTREKIDQEIYSKQKTKDTLESEEFQTWWNSKVLKLLEDSQTNCKEFENEMNSIEQQQTTLTSASSFHDLVQRLSHLRENHQKLFPNGVKESSREQKSPSHQTTTNQSFSSSTMKYYSPLLKEATSMLLELQSLDTSASQTQSGPLSQLEERHRQLDSAIAEAKRKTHLYNLEAERQERLILIERYKSEIPQLRQELATRPKASDVAEFKQRMIDQIQMLSSEMNEILGQLQLFEKRDELEQELESQILESATLKVEIASLQEQVGGLVDYAGGQKENIRQWKETERPRHESFIANLERERDQLRSELRMFNISISKDDEEEDASVQDKEAAETTKNGNDDEDERKNDQQDDSVVVLDNVASASPKRLVHVVHFDVETNAQESVETKKAPTKRWHRSAKFISEAEAIHHHLNNNTSSEQSSPNSPNRQNEEGEDDKKKKSFMTETLKILSDIYVPPMVEFTSTVNTETGQQRDDRTEASSLTVRMLSKISSWMFGDSSWVERGRKNKKKASVEVVV